ncbi:MAG TPA: response regulator, partial [Candidatus Bathyarchaeia archaeon]|nr:response regulator [Candidatus Bathyarchaeia archaeon]
VCFSLRLGAVAERLAAAGVTVTDDLTSAPDDVDVVHAQHRYESLLAFARYPDRPMVLVCHGVLPWQEQPMRTGLNVTRYVAVSEEVRDHLIRQGVGRHQVDVVRNGVDLERFRSRTPIAARPRRALVLSNYMPEVQRERVRRVCQRLGIAVSEAGAPRALWNVEEEINRADLVFGLGRSALEAMACQRAVLVYDYNGADGIVTPDRFTLLRERNFSGRTHRRQYSDADLAAEIDAYDPGAVQAIYPMIEREHDVREMARQYADLYEDARTRASRTPGSARATEVRQYGALGELIEEVTALRAKAETVERALAEIHDSRSWRALDVYRKLRAGLRLLRRRQAHPPAHARILVIDDDPLVGQWLVNALLADGHQVEMVETGRAGLDRLSRARFDLVLTDLQRPDPEGLSFYQELERTQPEMAQQVIFVTGSAKEPRRLARLIRRRLGDLGR